MLASIIASAFLGVVIGLYYNFMLDGRVLKAEHHDFLFHSIRILFALWKPFVFIAPAFGIMLVDEPRWIAVLYVAFYTVMLCLVMRFGPRPKALRQEQRPRAVGNTTEHAKGE